MIPEHAAGPVRPTLERAHRALVEDACAALALSRRPDSGIWSRWAAVQYVEHELAPRYRREREAVNAVIDRVASSHAAHVWALGELVEQLVTSTGELARRAQGGAPFAVAADKLVRALECWCNDVEIALGSLRWETLPEAARQRFEQLEPGLATSEST
jgi:hypothetical protein